MKKGFIRLSFSIIIAIFLLPLFAISQDTTKIRLVNANKLEFDAKKGENVRRLIGNVIFKHDSTIMFCDSAYLYADKNSLDAFSNVFIKIRDSMYIAGEFLTYDGKTKIAEIHDSVELVDEKTTLLANMLIYDRVKDFATYTTGGIIIDSLNELYSQIGEYYVKQKIFHFKKNVELYNPKYTIYCDTLKYNTDIETSYFLGPTRIVSKENLIYCENGWYDSRNDRSQFNKNAFLKTKEHLLKGDSLYYDRKNGIGKAFKNVYIHDSLQKITITGEIAHYNEKAGKTWATDNAKLEMVSDGDTLFLHADTLYAIFDTTKTIEEMRAYHKTRFYRRDLQGICDSLIYNFSDSAMYLFNAPIIWTDSSQLVAKRIKIRLDKKEVKQFFLFESAFINSRDDYGKFNQIAADSIIGFFRKNNLYKINTYSNSKTLYYLRDEKNRLIGINKAESINLQLFINNNEVKKIVFLTKPKATLYPEKDLTENDTKLEGFSWEYLKRPKDKMDIFVWR